MISKESMKTKWGSKIITIRRKRGHGKPSLTGQQSVLDDAFKFIGELNAHILFLYLFRRLLLCTRGVGASMMHYDMIQYNMICDERESSV